MMDDIKRIQRQLHRLESSIAKAQAHAAELHAMLADAVQSHGAAAGLSDEDVGTVVAPKDIDPNGPRP